MFRHLKIDIIDIEYYPQPLRERLNSGVKELLLNKLKAAENFTGLFKDKTLSVQIVTTRLDYAGVTDIFLNEDAEVLLKVGVNLKRDWSFSKAAIQHAFSHELGHCVFDIGKASTYIGTLLPTKRDYSHHMEYRADAFAAEINPESIECRKIFDSKATESFNRLFGSKSTSHPLAKDAAKAISNGSYRQILRKNLSDLQSLSEKGKSFSSFVDYLKNRSHYKETIGAIERL